MTGGNRRNTSGNKEQVVDKLCKGVRIYQQEYHSQRILLSSGTQHPLDTPVPVYSSGAFVPTLPWRVPRAEELERLRVVEPSDFHVARDIAIVKLPESLASRIPIFHKGSVHFQPPSDGIEVTPEQGAVIRDLREYVLQAYAISTEKVVGMPVVAGLQNQLTTTFDRGQGSFTGIHLDGWDAEPLSTRTRSTNRISVNIGKSQRYFLFLNLDLQQLADRTYSSEEQNTLDSNISWINRLGPEFMARHPMYPLVSVAVWPGEAYIAPTENVFHDGSTLNTTEIDLTLTVRGFFAAHSEAILDHAPHS